MAYVRWLVSFSARIFNCNLKILQIWIWNFRLNYKSFNEARFCTLSCAPWPHYLFWTPSMYTRVASVSLNWFVLSLLRLIRVTVTLRHRRCMHCSLHILLLTSTEPAAPDSMSGPIIRLPPDRALAQTPLPDGWERTRAAGRSLFIEYVVILFHKPAGNACWDMVYWKLCEVGTRVEYGGVL